MNGWTPERRAQQALNIRNWKPWAASTGPKSQAGKDRSKINAQRHGLRGREYQLLRKQLHEQYRTLNKLLEQIP